MKAIVYTKYGPPEVLKLKEMEKPQPKDDEVLVRNYGSSINTVDVIARSGKAPRVIFWGLRQLIGPVLRLSFGGIRKPNQNIPIGFGFAGKIESVGKEVTDWKVGDHIYGYSEKRGACAEYLTVPASQLAKKPANLSFQEAAAVPGGSSPALLAFRDLAQPKKDQKVLVIGASGGIGTFGVQIAKKVYGAEVTGVCGPTNVDMVKEIGADFVIDYSKEDYTKNNQSYDIIFDAIGVNTLSKCKEILTDEGVYVSNNPVNSPKTIFHIMTNVFRKKKIKSGTADESADNLNILREWIKEGQIKAVIDRIYPLEQIVEAHRYVDQGHKKGNVVITIGHY